MPRGGKRQGRIGAQYANRSDLRTPSAPLPVTTVPGQAYGAATQQRAAQQIVPMAANPVVAPPGSPPAVPPPASPTAAGGLPPLQPGQMGAFDRPTERPGEPVTAGLPSGAGPGPEALGLGGPTQPDTVAGVLQRIATLSPEANDLLARANRGMT
jgi:hypothetical protein